MKKKVVIIFLALVLLAFPCGMVAGEENVQGDGNQAADVVEKEKNNTENVGSEENVDSNNTNKNGDIQKLEVNWQEMNDMQIALAIINRQIEYLMNQVEKNNARIAEIQEAHVKDLEKVKAEKEAEIDQVKQKLADKERQLEKAREEINKLSARAAFFSAENDMAPRFVLVFSAGVIAGMIFNSVLNAIRKREK